MTTNLTYNLYQTNNNTYGGYGTISLTGPDSSGNFTAQVTLAIRGSAAFTPEQITGKGSSAGGALTISLNASQHGDLQMLLVQNPFQTTPVSFAGSLVVIQSKQIYNMSAIPA